MSDPPFPETGFLEQLSRVVGEHLSNERFGVSELAREVGMSRSSLLRKVKKASGLSVSQFIRQVRLQRAMELLKKDSHTVSEVSFLVGFSSPSYFIKCFREHYGYPPGEAERRGYDESEALPGLGTHRLAAIMFTDIEGYTALMQRDEEGALQLRNRHREVFNTITTQFGGKILQYYGDGTLSIFPSAIDAVKCGIALQRAFRSPPLIPVRIGIHSGDILYNAEDIIGDGVNVASRIESLAVAGSVFISGKVYDEVKNQPDIQADSLGRFEFKNVDKPLEVFAVTNQGLLVPRRSELSGKLKEAPRRRFNRTAIVVAALALLVLAGAYLIFPTDRFQEPSPRTDSTISPLPEKSIAVLPFINDSADSTNVYIINGLMESILNHLQQIEDLRVISRTSVEQYRHTTKTIPDIARELGVQYFVEGSGQKIGDEIQLNIQLIEATGDQRLWSEQFHRQAVDIFGLQREVAQKIADEIQVLITPDEEKRLAEVPTENLEAYDAFLKGRDFFYQGNREGLEKAITHYKQAVDLDPEFARAYAGLAISYYFLDFNQTEKHYSDQINHYADKALLYDAKSAQSLIAKALFYLYHDDHAAALPHLEKALEYNPNSAMVINLLADFYTRYLPDTEKYLEYALKGARLDIAASDSSTTSFTYLHIAGAFIQSGFVEEAKTYIDKSLAYYPDNLYSEYVKAFIEYARHRDLAQTRASLLATLAKDPARLDVMQEVAKISYFMRDYEEAYQYYQKFAAIKDSFHLDIYPEENAKIAMVLRKLGRAAEAERYMQRFRTYAAADQSVYRPLNRAVIAAYDGDTREAIEQLKYFSGKDGYHYWILLFLEKDPLMDEIKKFPAFRRTMRTIERKFWDRHERMRARLEEERLI